MEGSLVAYKVFTNGSVLNASEVNDNLMNQAVITFSNSAARASAITSPVEGMLTYLADTQTYESWDGAAWVAFGGGGAGTGNAIINGAFEIWQRGTSFTDPTSETFQADRFSLAYDGSGATRIVTRENFTPGEAPVAGYESAFFLRYARTVAGSGATFDRISQKIEDVRTFAGQTITLSFWAKVATGAPTITLRARQNFGSGGSAQVDVDTTVTLSTSWTRYTVNFNLPSLTGKTIGDNSFLEIHFRTALNTIQTTDLWGVQVEAGSTATPFRRNANSLQGELAACQRYYQKSYRQASTVPTNATTTNIQAFSSTSTANFAVYGSVNLATVMRAAPTVTTYSYATSQTSRISNNSGVDQGAGSGAVTGEGDRSFFVYNNSGGTITTTAGAIIHWAASAEL